jgi:hypothetical protein
MEVSYRSNRFARQRQDLGLEYYVNSFYSFPVTIYITQASNSSCQEPVRERTDRKKFKLLQVDNRYKYFH